MSHGDAIDLTSGVPGLFASVVALFFFVSEHTIMHSMWCDINIVMCIVSFVSLFHFLIKTSRQDNAKQTSLFERSMPEHSLGHTQKKKQKTNAPLLNVCEFSPHMHTKFRKYFSKVGAFFGLYIYVYIYIYTHTHTHRHK
jgi:hypothetical protein